MSDMINRDEVLAIIADLKKDYPTHSVPDAEAKVALRKVADKIRAIDAVSVVRCKECKHRHRGDNHWFCCNLNLSSDAESFYSFGDHKEDE